MRRRPSSHNVTCYARLVKGEAARERIQKLLVTGDNRLKQGVDPEKARESWEQALAVAREAGLGRHELRRTADAGRDDGASGGHALEQCLTERLDQAGLAEHMAGREQRR